MSAQVKDMTQGKPLRLIVSFALPLMLGNIFQQLYTVVDTAVVGQFVGPHALAALGAVDWPNWMILGLVTGFAQGFSILTAQRFGAGDEEGVRRTVTMSYRLAAVLTVLITAIALFVAKPILVMLGTPQEVMSDALTYLCISYSAIIVIMAYNVFSSILRALGDSRTPLVAMLIAAAVNIVLDLLFVAVFKWGVAGAGIATAIAQLFSGLFCLHKIGKIKLLQLHKKDWAYDRVLLRALVRLGTPMALQNAIIAIGGFAIQYVINGFGIVFMAGFVATNKLYGLLELAAISFGFSIATYAGQNLGAGKIDRIKEGMRAAVLIAAITSVCISALMLFFGKSILSLFISGEPAMVEQILDVAYTYLSVMAWLLSILYFLNIYRSALQGMGNTIMPMISGVVELMMRISAIMILPKLFEEFGIYLAEPAAWLGAAVVLILSYYHDMRKLSKKQAALADSKSATIDRG